MIFAGRNKKIKYAFPVVALILSLALCAGGVFAWLAYNVDLESKGLELTASASANVVIAASPTDVLNSNILNTPSPFAVTFTTPQENMQACTHVSNAGTYQLKYCKTPEGIAYNTGLPLSGSLETLLETVPQESGYFHDYTVYIAAVGDTLADVDLTVTVSATNVVTLTDTHKAMAVDFYVGGTAASNYKGTLNVAGLYPDNTGTALTSLSIYTGDIPENIAPDGYLTVVMRVYFDGNLKKPGGATTYVTSQTLNTSELGLSVHFEAK